MHQLTPRFTLQSLLPLLLFTASLPAQDNTPAAPAQAPPRAQGKQAGSSQGDSKSASGTGAAGESSATGKPSALSPLAPALPPPRVFQRPRIGLALGGGGALGLSEVGTLQWFEEHHIPVDVIAGTSMGCMISALYSTGQTPQQLLTVMNNNVFSSVFSLSNSYQARSFRRREDKRELPNGITVGLKHGVSFRNSVLIDQGLNAFLDRKFLRYDDQTDFNNLPIPLRCLSTDLNDARTVTFARGSLPDAVRASVSLPGIYSPFELDGHEYVDGGVLENLPTPAVKDMDADVILAVSLPLTPVGQGELNSLVGVLGRSFAVAIEGFERQQRKLATVVIMPDLTGFTAIDYLKTPELARRGYAAAEANRAALLPYALNDADWTAYLEHRRSLQRGAAGPVLRVRVAAPNESATRAVERLFAPLVNQPVNTQKIEGLLNEVRADGRYEADYTVGYETAPTAEETSRRPVILVTVADKKTGPPFLLVGGNLQAQAAGRTRATFETILLNQDLGGYGAELRTHVILGYLIDLNTEYYHPLLTGSDPEHTFFIAPRARLLRQPFPIYTNQVRLASRQYQRLDVGGDLGLTNSRTSELRAGLDFAQIRWDKQIGDDHQPDYNGQTQRARVQYTFDTQDRALVPQFGVHFNAEAAFLYASVGSPNAPQVTLQGSYAHKFGGRKPTSDSSTAATSAPAAPKSANVFVVDVEGGSHFNRNVAEPFRYTLGGPIRLSASAIDEYRGTDYALFEPALLHRIAQLPQPLGQNIYAGGALEMGFIRSPNAPVIYRGDIFLGLVAETPLGVITAGPAIGINGERKFNFTLGKLF